MSLRITKGYALRAVCEIASPSASERADCVAALRRAIIQNADDLPSVIIIIIKGG